MARLRRFALRPEVRVAGLVTHFGRAEVKPLGRLRRVDDRDARFLVGRDGLFERDHHLVGRDLVAGDFRGGPDRAHRQVNRIQFQLLKRLRDGLESEGDGSVHGTFFEVGRDVEGQMEDVNFAAGGVLQRAGGSRGSEEGVRLAAEQGFGFRPRRPGRDRHAHRNTQRDNKSVFHEKRNRVDLTGASHGKEA